MFLSTGLLDVAPTRATLVPGGDLGLVHLRPDDRPVGRPDGEDVVERCLAGLALVAFLPLLLAITIAIRLDSPGPSLFRQTRVGRDGRTFTMYKFRTMAVDAERVSGAHNGQRERRRPVQDSCRPADHPGRRAATPLLARRAPPAGQRRARADVPGRSAARPAPGGRAVRRRPPHRLVVKPGLTGLWQVSGRSDLSWEESVRLDLHYVDNWSLALDAAIVLRTLRAVVSHRGAY